jgi:hypothetical protein
MVKRRETAAAGHGGEQEMRDREVVRANRELAAYFKGQRTEREARAALKIIKAFVRDRERQDAKHRRPLPGRTVVAAPKDKERRATQPRVTRRVVRSRPHRVRENSPTMSEASDQLQPAKREGPLD